MEPILSLENISFRYPQSGEDALHGDTLDFMPDFLKCEIYG